MYTKKISTAYLFFALLCQAFPSYGKLSVDETQLVARAIVRDCIEAEVTRAGGTVQLTTSFNVENDWDNGYQITVTLKNPSSVATTSWSASFNLPNTTQTVASFWDAIYTKSGTLIKATNPSWIGGEVIPAGGKATFGFVIYNATKGTRTLANLSAVGTTGTPVPTPPSAPVLKAITQDTNPANYTVAWNTVANATTYTLQQSSSSSFANPTVAYQGAAVSKSFTGQPNGTYYYRVMASNASGSSAFSNVQSVTVSATPVLSAPVLNAIVQGTNKANYTASWSSVNGATSYTLQQSSSSSFANPTVAYQGTATSKAFTGQPNGTYYYRVMASNASGNSAFSTVQSVTVNVTPVLSAPVLNALAQGTNKANYTASWSSVAGATSYTLQQSTTATFASQTTVYQGAAVSKAFTGQPNGTYYYRVQASNASGTSTFSNVQSVTVNVAPSSSAIVEGYWESWNSNDSISSIVAMKTDVINVSFVTFSRTGTHTFSVVGLDTSTAVMTQLINAAHAAGKKVKVSVGGATYSQGSFLQSIEDAQGMAVAITQFVQQYNLDGVDFDIEDYPAPNLQIALLQNTRQQLGANAIISYTPQSPASTTSPYAQVIVGGYQYVDYISIMAYNAYDGYDYQKDVEALNAKGVPYSKIVVGLMPGNDDTGVNTPLSMIGAACQYILNKGLRGIMFWSLNRDLENQTGLGASAATNTSWSILHG